MTGGELDQGGRGRGGGKSGGKAPGGGGGPARPITCSDVDTDVVVILLSNFHHIKALNPAADI